MTLTLPTFFSIQTMTPFHMMTVELSTADKNFNLNNIYSLHHSHDKTEGVLKRGVWRAKKLIVKVCITKTTGNELLFAVRSLWQRLW
jgi:hypothetical protein